MMHSLYDRIGIGYDRSRRADSHLYGRLKANLEPVRGGRYVDIACGTGNYTAAFAAEGFEFYGFDISETMIAQARSKPVEARWLIANATQTPFQTGTFDGAICTLAIHHFPDIDAVMREIRRILRPDQGRLVIFSSTPDQMARYWLVRYFPDMMHRSACQMPDLDHVIRSLDAAGFVRMATEPYSVSPVLADHFLYSGKYRPWLYLDSAFRRGISSFAELVEPQELARGLENLRRDLEAGAFGDIISSYQNHDGDYLFITASL